MASLSEAVSGSSHANAGRSVAPIDDGVTSEDVENADLAAAAIEAAETDVEAEGYISVTVVAHESKYLSLAVIEAQPNHYVITLETEPVLVVAGKERLLSAVQEILNQQIVEYMPDAK